jgi:hypothetical protein
VKLTTRILESLCLDHGETLARFGEARLVKDLSGKIELLGGSPDDRREARQWCSMFMHEAIISPPATMAA